MAINDAMRSGHHLPVQPNGQNVTNPDEGRKTAGAPQVNGTVFLAGSDIEDQSGCCSGWPGERGSSDYNTTDAFGDSGYEVRYC